MFAVLLITSSIEMVLFIFMVSTYYSLPLVAQMLVAPGLAVSIVNEVAVIAYGEHWKSSTLGIIIVLNLVLVASLYVQHHKSSSK